MRLLSVLVAALLLAALAASQNPSQNPTSQAPLDNCSNLQTCEDCNNGFAACGWCAPTLSCHPGNFTGPTDGTKCLQEWFPSGGTGPAICPSTICTPIDNCLDCLKERSCGWCEPTATGGGSCAPLGSACPGGEPADQSCPCQYYEQCTDCLDDGGCVFCKNSLSCETIDPNNGNCGDNPNNQLTNSCPCDSWTSCDTCNGQEGCGWCDGKQSGCVEFANANCAITHTCHTCPSTHGFNAGSFVGGLFLMLGIVVLLAGSYFLYTTYFARGRQDYQTVQ